MLSTGCWAGRGVTFGMLPTGGGDAQRDRKGVLVGWLQGRRQGAGLLHRMAEVTDKLQSPSGKVSGNFLEGP